MPDPKLEKAMQNAGLMLLKHEWQGYSVWLDPEIPGMAFLLDKDGNVGGFYASDQNWNGLEELLQLVQKALNAGRIKWYDVMSELRELEAI